MLPDCFSSFQIQEYEARHNLTPLSAHSSPDGKPAGRHIVFTDDDIYNELGDEAYFTNMNELDLLRSRYGQVNARNIRNHEIKQSVIARREFLRLVMNQLHKLIRIELQSQDRQGKQYSAQGHGQPAPDNKGVHDGPSLRHSIGRIEDLDRRSADSTPIGNESRGKTMRRQTGKIAAYLEAEKRRLEASIEREEEVEKRLVEEIYKGTSDNAALEMKRQRVYEILQGHFGFVEDGKQ
jgi:hypothetical protein